MTRNEKHDHATAVVARFTRDYIARLRRQLGQIIPGADAAITHPAAWLDDEALLAATMEPQEWLVVARAGLGLLPDDADRGEVHEICQSMAEWLFAVPDHNTYQIPDIWYETDMGALWAAALIWCQGDALIPLSEAAELAGVSVQAISARVDRGTLRAYTDPTAPHRQGRRLVRRSDITTT